MSKNNKAIHRNKRLVIKHPNSKPEEGRGFRGPNPIILRNTPPEALIPIGYPDSLADRIPIATGQLALFP